MDRTESVSFRSQGWKDVDPGVKVCITCNRVSSAWQARLSDLGTLK